MCDVFLLVFLVGRFFSLLSRFLVLVLFCMGGT